MESFLGMDENHWCLHSWPREAGTKVDNEVTSVSKYTKERRNFPENICAYGYDKDSGDNHTWGEFGETGQESQTLQGPQWA